MKKRNVVLLAMLFSLVGCGGGGGSSKAASKTYQVTGEAGAGGALQIQTPNPQEGASVKAVATPNAGFGVDSFNGCGAGTADYATYTSAPITANCTISVTFKKVAAIQGTAAEGAALVNAPVIAKCADGSGFTSKVLTKADGSFIGYVGENAFPCALQVAASPSKTYYSLAQAAGITNITLLSDLALTIASGKTAADWFAASDWNAITAKLPAALTQLQDALFNQGYDIPTGDFQPLTQNFKVGDSWDQLLDQIRDGAELSSYKNYAALAMALKSDLTKLVTPTGSDKLSAEICSNPELFADGTTWSLGIDQPETTDQNGRWTSAYQLTFELLSQTTATENGVPVQTMSFHQRVTTFSGAAENKVTVKRTIDAVTKSEKVFYEDIEALDGSFHLVLETLGTRTVPFNLHKGETYSSEYTEISHYLSAGTSTQYDYAAEVTFNGLTSVVRNNAAHTVCEFSIQTNSRPSGASVPQHQTVYKRIHDGLDMTSPYLTFYILNGKEIYKKSP